MTTPYAKLKATLIACFSKSEETKLRQLLDGEAIGDRSPLQFLHHLGSYLFVYLYGRMKCKPTPVGYQLHAANGSLIETYGCITLSLNLGSRQEFTRRFIITDVTKLIIGADFLSHFNLLIDLKHKQLRDGFTGLQTSVDSIRSDAKCIKLIEGDTVYHKLLSIYPAITRPEEITSAKKHSTVHHIKTKPGPSVSCKALRFAPNKLKIAQEEFRKMVQLGITRPSTRPWESPLHVVPKKSGDWRLSTTQCAYDTQ
ncbi:uncharacterized protein LOC103574922 [Microplitis demolitor]|uniref:uncharacterized protein LOC103574922 n=1 Tax=Microplitis demolitor TaxID=69319 RepID=UPI0004CCBEE2|nr:uncharacterized protein LOC103574922 [Microplitis demolitor]